VAHRIRIVHKGTDCIIRTSVAITRRGRDTTHKVPAER
jgi:hypothetical protein